MKQVSQYVVGINPIRTSETSWLVWIRSVYLVVIWGMAYLVGLGGSSHLTYHEAFVAQGAREIVSSGNWWYPKIGGLPWLEKPPLPFWLVAGLGRAAGEITPGMARLPSALAALGLVAGLCILTTYRFGPVIGILAGAIQATTAWTVLRGRLAEADILLACVLTWAIVALDRMRQSRGLEEEGSGHMKASPGWKVWRWAFFVLLGITSFIKGTGFGSALVLSVVLILLVWDRDDRLRARLWFPAGWLAAGLLIVIWPLAMVWQHGGKVIGLWLLHVASRVSTSSAHGVFARESWSEYVLNILGQGLPWTPLALIGAFGLLFGSMHALGKSAVGIRNAESASAMMGNRLIWAWALGPLVLVSLASARNAHYAIYAMIPWSIWSAQGVSILGSRLRRRGWPQIRVVRLVFSFITGLGVSYGLGFWLISPWFDHRAAEAAFYQEVNRQIPASDSLELLYDDWDREPYPTPFGPIPHDLALRLYYLNRPACWHFNAESLADHKYEGFCDGGQSKSNSSLLVIGRDRDLPALRPFGEVEVLKQGSGFRWDRTYLLAQVRRPRDLVSSARTESPVSR